jgi:hypothetical protein
LIQYCGASTVGVWLLENQQPQCLLNSSGYQATLPAAILEKVSSPGKRQAAIIVNQRNSKAGFDVPRLLSSSPVNTGSLLIIDVWGSNPASDLSAAEVREIVQGVTDLAVSFSLRKRVDELSQRVVEQRAIHQILSASQPSGTLEDQSRALANILLDALEMDRVSFFQVTAGGARLLALVPASNLNQRSSQVGMLCRLASGVAHDGGWLALRVGEGLELSPGIKSIVHEYLQASLAREISALSTGLRRGASSLEPKAGEGVIVMERFTLGDAKPSPIQRDLVVNHSGDWRTPENQVGAPYRETLIAHALDSLAQQLSQRTSPMLRIADFWRSATLSLRGLLLGIAGTLLLASLFLMPSRQKFTVEGVLQPKASRAIFATRDGVIETLYAQHGQSISLNQPLLKIRSPDLELELQKLFGQVETLEAKLLSVKSAKMKQGSERASENAIRLSAEEEDLKIQLLGVRKQLDIVKVDQESLTILSPLDGIVDGWDMEQALDQRPVVHGQRLLQVYQPEAGWQLNLEIPDDVAGTILDSQQKAACAVEFRIRSDPSKSYASLLSSISQTTQVNASQQAVVFAKVDLSLHPIDVTRSGAMVVAQIDCGWSTLGFIWFREITEFLQRSFWF